MTLQVQVQQALAGLLSFSSGEEQLDIVEAGQRLHCRLVALDSMACAFGELTLHADRLAGMKSDHLKQVAEHLSAKLTYLLEPISPIETDATGCVVQMRSNPPQKDADRTSYYELLVAHTGTLSLTRYTRPTGQSRQIIPAQVTREVFARLVGDLSAAAG